MTEAQSISIHALLAESDRHPNMSNHPHNIFLSTLSLRRATRGHTVLLPSPPDFYPRSPCGERLTWSIANAKTIAFLSTLSLRRATVHYDNYNLHCVISIHALLAESDRCWPRNRPRTPNFYPRSPCGERHEDEAAAKAQAKFLSTLSLRRATSC